MICGSNVVRNLRVAVLTDFACEVFAITVHMCCLSGARVAQVRVPNAASASFHYMLARAQRLVYYLSLSANSRLSEKLIYVWMDSSRLMYPHRLHAICD